MPILNWHLKRAPQTLGSKLTPTTHCAFLFVRTFSSSGSPLFPELVVYADPDSGHSGLAPSLFGSWVENTVWGAVAFLLHQSVFASVSFVLFASLTYHTTELPSLLLEKLIPALVLSSVSPVGPCLKRLHFLLWHNLYGVSFIKALCLVNSVQEQSELPLFQYKKSH